MRLFRRREETLNDKLLREAGLSPEGAPVHDSREIEPSYVRSEVRDPVTTSVEVADFSGSLYDFVTLPGGSVIAAVDAPNLSPLADAVDEELDPPYRAVARRQTGDFWSLTAFPIRVESLTVDGDELEVSSAGGIATFSVDGHATDPSRAPSRLVASASSKAAARSVRATRLDGDLWEVRADEL